MPAIRVLSRTDVECALGMKEAIDLMRTGFCLLSEGKVDVPMRVNMPLSTHDGRALFMPVYSPVHARLAQKIVTIHPGNDTRGLPFIHALVFIADASTGRPLAIMDGESITALRTGAGSGLATNLLAREDATVAAVFGAGVQARSQLEAMCAVRPITKAYVFGRRSDRADTFARKMTARLDIEVCVAPDPETLAMADVIATATTSLTPVFDPRNLRAGCHINGIGSFRPDMTEIPAETVKAATVVVDQRSACLAEAGDILVPIARGDITADHIHAEIGEIVAGTKPGRTTPDEITLFKSVGNAIQDLVVANRLVELAQSEGIGTEIEI